MGAVPVVVERLRALNIAHAIHAVALQVRVSTVDPGVDDGDLGSRPAVARNHTGCFRKTTPDNLRLDVEDAIDERVLLGPYSVERVRLDIADERSS